MAPRRRLRPCRRPARGAGLAAGLWLAAASGAAACDTQGNAMHGSLTRVDATAALACRD